jgi:type IV secretion system protein VirD4
MSGTEQSNPTALNRPTQTPYIKIIGVAATITLINSAMTQWLASQFHYQPALGKPLFGHIYSPFAWFVWQKSFEAAAPKTFNEAYIGLFAILAIGVLASIWFKGFSQKAKPQEGLYGTAHWATKAEIEETSLLAKNGEQNTGVYVGGWLDPKTKKMHYLKHDGQEHIACIAPTRSGKGVGLVVPTLLSWMDSAVIHDLKGELWQLTAGWRKTEGGNTVLKFDPAAAEGSCAFNPLAEIRVNTEYETSDVQNLVTIIVDPDGLGFDGPDGHWKKTSHAFLIGVVIHLLHKENGRIPSLADVARTLADPQKPIYKLYNEMLDTNHPVIAASARDMLDKPDNERGSVVSAAMSFLSLYRDPIVAKNIGNSDFKIKDLMNHDNPVSLYLVVSPANKDRLKPLMRLILNQIIRTLTREGTGKISYKHRLLLMLDEFPSFGKLEVFNEALAFIAGYGIKAYLIMQDITQLKATYTENESILSNCHIRIAYAPNKPETAKWLSELTGTTTVNNEVITTSGKRFGWQNQVNKSIHPTSRALLTPDECMRLKAPIKNQSGEITEPGEMLIFAAGHSPIYGRQILFFKDAVFAKRSQIPAPSKSESIHVTV